MILGSTQDHVETCKEARMDPKLVSIIAAALTVSIGAIGPALAEGRAVAAAMDAIARQPEATGDISRTLFVGLAMIETTAIYCLVVALLLLFANPYVE
jgi:F-type H+-transporting ATPase subunit c